MSPRCRCSQSSAHQPQRRSPRSHVQPAVRAGLGEAGIGSPVFGPGRVEPRLAGNQESCFGRSCSTRPAFRYRNPAAGACRFARSLAPAGWEPGRETVRHPQRGSLQPQAPKAIVMAIGHRCTVGCPCRGCSSQPGDPIGRVGVALLSSRVDDRFPPTRPVPPARGRRRR